MNQEVIAFLPCRKGSQRIKNKNTRPFAHHQNGLLEIKLQQLLACDAIDKIIVSTNDESVANICLKLCVQDGTNSRIFIDERPDHLGSSSTSTDEVINYVSKKFIFSHLLWTHVTSPFVDAKDYGRCIEEYFNALQKGYDSLMTVQSLQGFVWSEQSPINYDRQTEKWPRTQTLPKLYEIDSAAFIAPYEVYTKQKDRIGKKPYLLDLNKEVNIDIDWPRQFKLAETLYLNISNE